MALMMPIITALAWINPGTQPRCRLGQDSQVSQTEYDDQIHPCAQFHLQDPNDGDRQGCETNVGKDVER